MPHLLIFGLGYSGRAVAQAARDAGLPVTATTRDPDRIDAPDGCATVAFDRAAAAIAQATHLLATAPPSNDADPVLAAHGDAIAANRAIVWIGYLSTTGVYGDRGGATVDEATPPDPTSDRARRRIAAEQAWSSRASPSCAVDLIRLAGIYGPGRSVLDDVRRGTARPIRAPGHAFGRIHRDDIAGGIMAAIATADPSSEPIRVLNFTDDEPAESADVIREAARLLGVEPPPERSLADAWSTMSPMARSFWSDNRRVASVRTQHVLGRRWRHPTYREGLGATLDAEHLLDQPQHHGEV